MSKDMLGAVIRASVGVPQNRLDTLAKITSKLSKDSPEGDRWNSHFKGILKNGLPSVEVVSQAEVTPQLGTIIRVDRLKWPSFSGEKPGRIRFLFPELAHLGPTEYDLASIELWRHPRQKKDEPVNGEVIFRFLVVNEMFDGSFLGLEDGSEILRKDVKIFLKYFGKVGKLYLWRSAFQYGDERIHVPYLYECHDKVTLTSSLLSERWASNNVALRFAS